MKTKLIILAAITAALSACQKNDIQSNSEDLAITQKGIAVLNEAVTDLPGNPLNPYDSIGYWHNYILSNIQPCLSDSNTPDVSKITACIIPLEPIIHTPQLQVSSFDTVVETVSDQQNNFSTVIGQIPYPAPVKALIDTLINLVAAQAAGNVSYETAKASIESFETQIMQDKTLNENGKRILLRAASVARYSLYYWTYTNPKGAALKFKNIVKWIAAVTSDIAGTAIGGNPLYAAGCSQYAFTLVTYSMP